MLDRERADAQERRPYGGGRRLRQLHQLPLRMAQKHAMPGEDHRAFGSGQGLGGLPRLVEVDVTVQLVAGEVQVLRGDALRIGLLDVLADIDQDGTRPAGGGDVERLVDDARQLVDPGHEVAVLGDGAGCADDVRFLERVAPNLGADDLPGDGDHRHRVHVGGAESRDQVQGARTGRGEHDSRLARGAGVAVGHVRGALLMADQDVLEVGVLGQVLVDRQVGAARVAKDVLDTFALQRFQDHVGSGQLVAGSFLVEK